MIRLTSLLSLLFILYSCQNGESLKKEAPFTSAVWIGSTQELPEADSAWYADFPAPVFEKVFRLKTVPDAANLRVTAAGYYTVWINGSKVGSEYLAPAWTDYSKRIYYSDLPVAALLKKGENTIRVELGNGWFNPLPLRLWGHVNLRERLTVGQPRFILDLEVGRKDQLIKRIVSDTTWTWAPGEIMRNSIYTGEWHNLNNKPSQINEPVRQLDTPGGKLQMADFPAIHRTDSVVPTALWLTASGSLMVDFGQNLAGSYRYSGPGQPGDSLIFRLGERIWPDSTLNPLTAVTGQIKRLGTGGPGAPAVAEQMDVFIPAASGDVFEPRYSFHGFRYMEISGPDQTVLQAIKPTDLIAWRMGTDVPDIAGIEADPGWINDLQNAVEWTFLSNIFSVISDCPAREKFGYGGDLNATVETWLYQYDARDFLIKTLRDWTDAMHDQGFVDTAPFVGIQYCGISWESAFLLVQDYLFRFYGDERLVLEWYDTNVAWMNKAKRLLGSQLVKNGLADHESLEPVPVELVGSLHYYHCQRVMQRFAGILGKESEALAYKQEADLYQQRLVDSLWLHPVKPIKNVQTWMSGLLYYQILPEQERGKAVSRLVSDLQERGMALTTGIFGTPWMLEALATNGQVQLAWDLVSRTDYPGWRFMLNQGATTIWETWKESDNVFSQNHPMFGSVSGFLYKWIGGIDPVDQGFDRFLLHPAPVTGIKTISFTRQLKQGTLRISWERTSDQIVFDLEVPDQTEIIWTPQVVRPDQLDYILGPDGRMAESKQQAIRIREPGKFKLSYQLKPANK